MNKRLVPFGLLIAALAPATAWAHPGHGLAQAGHAGALMAGLLHPLTGIDHLVALLLVGLCGRSVKNVPAWLLPAGFLAAMAAGFAAGAGARAELAEAVIAASLVALGLAAALRVRTGAGIALLAVVAFGYAHGLAHGIETPRGAPPMVFAAGFLAMSATIAASGLWLGGKLPATLQRVAGGLAAGLGMVLALAG